MIWFDNCTILCYNTYPDGGVSMNNVEIRLKKEKLIQTIKNNLKGGELKTVEKSILDKNDPFLSYLFAKEINGADINSHLNVVINSNDAQMMYTFAM